MGPIYALFAMTEYTRTIGSLRDRRYGLVIYCLDCMRWGPADMDRLIDRLGADYDYIAGRSHLLGILKCADCGGKHLDLQLRAPLPSDNLG